MFYKKAYNNNVYAIADNGNIGFIYLAHNDSLYHWMNEIKKSNISHVFDSNFRVHPRDIMFCIYSCDNTIITVKKFGANVQYGLSTAQTFLQIHGYLIKNVFTL